MNDDTLGFLITWTIYGTFLQGDSRGWRKRRKGTQTSQPKLAEWHADRLKYPILRLDDQQRCCVTAEIQRLCNFRGWRLWASSVRTNHVHVVVHAKEVAGSKVRDQMKANATRVLRECWKEFVDRPVWTYGGDWQCVNDESSLEQVILYVLEAQDRKGFETQ